VFIFGDQERYFPKWPTGLSLPGHERLQRSGVTFENHYTSAIMCTPSRAVLATGLQTPDNRMFDNADVPWVKSLSTDVPTIGHMLRKAGYYTAYKGKWHLNKEFDTHEPEKFFTKEMDAYGFSDYVSPGDLIAHTLGGYEFDHLIAGSAVSWLRRVGRPLSNQGKPWSLFVSLVNPHDIMYFNTDAPGQKVQDAGKLLKRAARARSRDLQVDVGPTGGRNPSRGDGCTWSSSGSRRVPQGLGPRARAHPSRRGTVAAVRRLLHQLYPDDGPPNRESASGTR
jgi:arylsulfatase A-like enzyme